MVVIDPETDIVYKFWNWLSQRGIKNLINNIPY